jgi:chorismate synthase
LSRTCRDIGFRATAIEKNKQRAKNFLIFTCDVTKQEDAKQLMDYIEAESDSLGGIIFIFF